MSDEAFAALELKSFEMLDGKLGNIHTEEDLYKYISNTVKSIDPAADKPTIDRIVADAKKFDPIDQYLHSESVEDIMVNNTENIFIYHATEGNIKVPEKVASSIDLDHFVKKLRMYATSEIANNHIADVHLPNGSRCNIIDSPLGPAITIRNFKPTAFSIIDLVNAGELSYNLAARYWLYAEGLGIRPANQLIGGMPGSGKSSLLNAMFSFFRPEARIVLLEETYELNTSTQENCVRLETRPDMGLDDLLRNSLRMRPDLIIVGEVRGAEAKDMMAAMSIGKSVISTIHAHTARDMVTRLEHDPMKISRDTIPMIDAMTIVSQVNEDHKRLRKIVQVAETSGIETQVLLSDLYTYDYKTHKSSDILPSVTFRDVLSKATGRTPTEIIAEENRRGRILEKLNQMGIRDMRGISDFCRDYYDNPERAIQKVGLSSLGVLQ